MREDVKAVTELLKNPSFLLLSLVVYVTPILTLGGTLYFTMTDVSLQLRTLVDISKNMLYRCDDMAYTTPKDGVR